MSGDRDSVSLAFHWFLPTHGDGRRLIEQVRPAGIAGGPRPASLGYLTQVACAAEELGFAGALTPTGLWCEDAWVTAAMLSQRTERLRFMLALRPGLVSPTLAAQMAASFQRHSYGRLLLNVVTGGDREEQRALGDFLDKDARYERTAEFLGVVRDLWRGRRVDLDGRHLTVAAAELEQPPSPPPPIYFGGSSPAALAVAARHAQVYLSWGEPPGPLGEKLDAVRAAARAAGRELRLGIRLHVVCRDSAAEAWREAERLLDGIDASTIQLVQERLRRSESEGQRRMTALHDGSLRGPGNSSVTDLEVAPNLWAGVGLARGGAGTALVGSHQEVAARIHEYAQLGIDEFVLSGYPHLEEAYWFAEGVLPILAQRLLWTTPGPPSAAPFPPAREHAAAPGAAARARVPFAGAPAEAVGGVNGR
ncbi:MAG TPA: LLM class flavin-dependent oxidoreductase [Solirubrobacteraceae bacterium]|nr:LLM class flavin-dependent oxidoreductase [Solirubrobacteraceae bacterium]